MIVEVGHQMASPARRMGVAAKTCVCLILLASAASATFSSIIISTPIRDIACKLVANIAEIAAAIAFVVVVGAAMQYVYSQGDPGKRKQAKDMIIHAIVGLIVIVLANALVNFSVGGVTFSGC